VSKCVPCGQPPPHEDADMKDKLSLDATGQYRRDLGWKPGKNGG
jgi:hypothetical protein